MKIFQALSQSIDRKTTTWLMIVVLVTLIVRIIVAMVFPLTGDEAYFAMWGIFPAGGYYDHTPLVGWILYPLTHLLGTSNLVLRSPTILVTTLIGLLIYYFLCHEDKKKAFWISVLYLISPLSLLAMFITTDVPLIFFAFLSGLFLYMAFERKDHLGFYLLSGLCLGLAFFSKYFAVLLALAYIIYFFMTPITLKKCFGFFLLFLMVIPFGLQNIYWNYTHAWSNILFNVYNRNDGMHFSFYTILLYFLVLLYIVTPPIVYYFIRALRQFIRLDSFRFFLWMTVIPFTFFFILSFYKKIGLHWPLAFVPFIYVLLIRLLSLSQLKRCALAMAIFTGLHIILLAGILLLPPAMIAKHLNISKGHYTNLLFAMKYREIRALLKPYDARFVIASPSYAKADLMYIDSGIYSPTLGGVGSAHGREGDFVTDYKQYAGKNFFVIDSKPLKAEDYRPYFKKIQTGTMPFKDTTFYTLKGYYFNYPKYRDQVLRKIYQIYWTVPNYLPHGKNFYCEKYFAADGNC